MNNNLFLIAESIKEAFNIVAESITEACFEIAGYIVDTIERIWISSQLTILIVAGGVGFMWASVLLHGGFITF